MKKFKIKGKHLSISEIKSKKEEIFKVIGDFIDKYLSESPYFEVQTSGSTGVPKVISLQKLHMRNSALKTIEFLRLKPNDKALLCISARHIGGIMVLVRWLEGRLDLYPQLPDTDPIKPETPGLDFAAMVPLQVHHSIKKIGSIKKLIIGGGAINPDLEEKLADLKNEIYHTYGMTETISHIAMRRLNGFNGKDVFTTLENVSINRDERNCLVINAPDIGVNDLVTNDVVELMDDNHFKWKGRYDNVINSGGIKLHPEEIEKKIGALQFEYFLTATPDELLGEKLTLVAETSERFLLQDLESNFQYLGRYEKPRAIIWLDQFVRTETGKISRSQSLKKSGTT